MKKIKKLCGAVLIAGFMLPQIILGGNNAAEAANGKWKQNGKKWSYSYSDGTYPKNKWEKIDGKWYHFDKSGYRQTGWQTIDGKTYYFNGQGVMQTGWRTYSGKKYYFNGKGVMQTGWRTYKGKKYYFNGQGVMQTGWRTYSCKKYYFNAQGVLQTGIKKIKGKTYYFNDKGIMQTGWQYYNGNKYYFNGQGIMQTGWRTYNGKKYYFDGQGVMQTGWKEINGFMYYFNGQGVMQTGWKTIDGKKYYFDEYGSMMIDWIYFDWDEVYYFNDNGVMQTGWKEIDECKYYFNDQGLMQIGWLEYNGKKYYFNEEGQMQTGVTLCGNEKYVFDENGVLLRKQFRGLSEISTAKVGDYVTLGSYEQDNNLSNGKEAITWRVLAKENGKLLLISEYALECRKYNETYEEVTWETCTLRKWLNSDFYNMAFKPYEKTLIQTKALNDDNSAYGSEGDNNTKDKVFLLSSDEIAQYFDYSYYSYYIGDYDDLCCKSTSYVLSKGADTGKKLYLEGEQLSDKYNDCCAWWLRSPGDQQDTAEYVDYYGMECFSGRDVDDLTLAVRPAIWITIK